MVHLRVYNTILLFSGVATGVYIFIWYLGIENLSPGLEAANQTIDENTNERRERRTVVEGFLKTDDVSDAKPLYTSDVDNQEILDDRGEETSVGNQQDKAGVRQVEPSDEAQYEKSDGQREKTSDAEQQDKPVLRQLETSTIGQQGTTRSVLLETSDVQQQEKSDVQGEETPGIEQKEKADGRQADTSDVRPLERIRALKMTKPSNKTKIIYIWHRPKWLFMSFGSTQQEFKKNGCPVSNCRVVDKSTYPLSSLSEADSILFTIADFFGPDKPKRTNAEQIWVMWHNEAPLHNHPITFEMLNDLFNLTYSYLDEPQTDIYRPLGRIIKRPSNLRYNPPSPSYIKNKTGLVSWIVSNCISKGQRQQYVEQLSKYIKVDIYGRCGMNCSRVNDYCFKMVANKYKFYLAFESMYCEHYMTEKIFRPLSGFIVPIVLGGANYSRVLPEKSFIDVRDFASPKDLATYLKYLDRHDDKYVEYFKWKEKYMAVSRMLPGLCDLCEILNTPGYPYKAGFRFDEYWNPKKYCKIDQEERRALHLE